MIRIGFLALLIPVTGGCVTMTFTAGEEQVIDTGEVMELLMDPIHEDLKDFIENPPEKRADWRGLYVAAYTLAETNNLLYSRTDHAYMLDEEWRGRVDESRARTAALGEAVKQRQEYEAIKGLYISVVESCNTCHQRYNPDERDAPIIEVPRPWDLPAPGRSPDPAMEFH